MRKLIFTLFFVFITFFASAQTFTKTLQEGKSGPVKYKYEQVVKDGDTSSYVYAYFPNSEYQYIIDMGGVFFWSPTELEEFISDVEKALPLIGTGVDASFDKKEYSLLVYDWSKALRIKDEKGKYTILTKNQVRKLIEGLKTIEFR